MATAGQLKAKIDLLKKKIAEQSAALPPLRKRGLNKRLRRLQRSRRVAARREDKGRKKPTAAAEAAPAGAAPAAESPHS
jgi:hypothetical protein